MLRQRADKVCASASAPWQCDQSIAARSKHLPPAMNVHRGDGVAVVSLTAHVDVLPPDQLGNGFLFRTYSHPLFVCVVTRCAENVDKESAIGEPIDGGIWCNRAALDDCSSGRGASRPSTHRRKDSAVLSQTIRAARHLILCRGGGRAARPCIDIRAQSLSLKMKLNGYRYLFAFVCVACVQCGCSVRACVCVPVATKIGTT